MDIYESCHKKILQELDQLNEYLKNQSGENGSNESSGFSQTQNILEIGPGDKDKNLDRIMEQQIQLKMIIDRDRRIKSLKMAISEDTKTIEELRKDTLKIEQNAASHRQEQLVAHTSNVEKFQMQQLKSIADDFKRHQDILEQRKKEIKILQKETEDEEKNREAYLKDVEKKLELELRNRQQLRRGGGIDDAIIAPASSTTGTPRDRIELTSVDEYAPYGTAPNSKTTGGSKRGGGGGRGRRKNKS